MPVIDLPSKASFDAALQHAPANRVVMIAFHAQWSAASQTLAPYVVQLSAHYHSAALFARCDVDACADVWEQQNAKTVPTFSFYVNRERVHVLSTTDGGSLHDTLRALIATHTSGVALPPALPAPAAAPAAADAAGAAAPGATSVAISGQTGTGDIVVRQPMSASRKCMWYSLALNVFCLVLGVCLVIGGSAYRKSISTASDSDCNALNPDTTTYDTGCVSCEALTDGACPPLDASANPPVGTLCGPAGSWSCQCTGSKRNAGSATYYPEFCISIDHSGDTRGKSVINWGIGFIVVDAVLLFGWAYYFWTQRRNARLVETSRQIQRA